MRHPREKRSSGQLSRREFLARGAATAAAVPMAGTLLAACGKPESTTDEAAKLPLARPDAPVTLPVYDDNPAIASDLPIEEGATLKLYNWDQYVYKKVMDDFAAKYNCKYEISTFNNMDEALAKIRSTNMDIDVFFPTPDVLAKLVLFRLLQPLNLDYIPNLPKYVWPEFTAPDKPFYDQGQHYTVPYMVYTTGIGWRNDMVDQKDDPWHLDNPYDIYWNPKYKGKIGIYDDYREAMSMALLHNGVTDINTGDATALSDAEDSLVELIDKVNIAITMNGAYEDLPKGIFAIHQGWSGDILASPYYGTGPAAQVAPLISYWWPKDGHGVIGNDVFAVPKSAKNPVLAHTFLNYMLGFDAAMKNFSWMGYQPPQIDAPPEAFSDPNFRWSWVVWPNLVNCIVKPTDFDRGYFYLELEPKVDQIWHDDWEVFISGV